MNHKLKYILELADNVMILGQRLSEWVGHGPVLEQDIAITNISLDLIGEARNWYQYAAEIEGHGKDENYYPFLRKEKEFFNCLLTEQPNVDWAYTMARQFLFDCYHFHYLDGLRDSSDEKIAAIAAKSVKEAAYHKRFSSVWILRLGDGTEISHQKIQLALDDYFRYFEEFFMSTEAELEMASQGITPDISLVKSAAYRDYNDILKEARLKPTTNVFPHHGGKKGKHTEHMGYILADMQYMQRAYPNLQW